MLSDRITFPHQQIRTIYPRIEPQPTGIGLNDVLDGEWLQRPFSGLLQPTIKDLPMEFPYDATGLSVGVVRLGGEWCWEISISSLSHPHDEPQLKPKVSA